MIVLIRNSKSLYLSLSDTVLRSSLRESNMRSTHDSVCSNISLCNDTGYSVDVGVQADR